jgi:hypothetical protein
MSAEEKEYQAEADLSTLIAAEKIKRDEKRFKAALKCRDEKMSAMQSLDEEKDEY